MMAKSYRWCPRQNLRTTEGNGNLDLPRECQLEGNSRRDVSMQHGDAGWLGVAHRVRLEFIASHINGWRTSKTPVNNAWIAFEICREQVGRGVVAGVDGWGVAEQVKVRRGDKFRIGGDV